MKIRIIGPCGSGKTYIAKELSRKYNTPYYELDNLIWNRTEVQRRNSIEVRDALLMDILRKDSWIIEGVHYKWGMDKRVVIARNHDLHAIMEERLNNREGIHQ